jgi:hypothetical protein
MARKATTDSFVAILPTVPQFETLMESFSDDFQIPAKRIRNLHWHGREPNIFSAFVFCSNTLPLLVLWESRH